MKKYFKTYESEKISLSDYVKESKEELTKFMGELQSYKRIEDPDIETYTKIYKLERLIKEQDLKRARIKHILKCLGDVSISRDGIEAICEIFASTEYKYGTVCLKAETINGIYEITEMFPEFTKEALLSIGNEYIKDLFDKYSLIETLCVKLKKEGSEDSTFESFMKKVKKFALQEQKKYETEAYYLGVYYGYYSFSFIQHFQEFIKKHHITCEQFGRSLPDVQIILQDELQLREIELKSKECFVSCFPLSYQMLESYLDGNIELAEYPDEAEYLVSIYGKKFKTTFTKAEFLESIKKKETSLTRCIKKEG